MSGEKNTKSKKTSKAEKVFNICIVAALCAAIVFGLVMAVINAVKPKTAENAETSQTETAELEKPDFGEGLTEEGFIEGIEDETKYVELRFDINDPIEVPASVVYVSDGDVEDEENRLVQQYGDDMSVFNETFIKEQLESDLTVEEYAEKIRNDLIRDKKAEYVEDYILHGYYTLDVPDTYIDTQIKYIKYVDQLNLQYINNMYLQLTGTVGYEDVYAYRGILAEDYEQTVSDEADISVVEFLAYQLLFKELGLEITQADIDAFILENDIVYTYTDYGMPYIKKQIMRELVNKTLTDRAVIVEDQEG